MTIGAKSLELMQHGPLLRVDVRHHPASFADLVTLGARPQPTSETFLVDTGAALTMINREIIVGLGIEPIGAFTAVRTAAGIVDNCPTYRVELMLHLDDGPVGLATTVVGLPPRGFLDGPRYRGVLGRSSLQPARFLYDGFAGTFRIEIAR